MCRQQWFPAACVLLTSFFLVLPVLLLTDVTVAQPGYDVNWQDDITNMESQVTTDGNGTLSDPSNYPPACPIGTYYEGGVINSGTTSTCKPCPLGTTTQSTGSTSADECSE
jgi:hypothetical protein